MVLSKAIKALEGLAPLEMAEEWDNCGLLLGDINAEINNILVALDLTDHTVKQAIDNKCNLIVTHHPMFLTPLKSITSADTAGSHILKLISNGIAVYCCHTNLDSAKGGVNDALGKSIGLDEKSLVTSENTLGRMYLLEQELLLKDLVQRVKRGLNCKGVMYSGDENRVVKKIALCSGAGGFFVNEAIANNADVLITGEAKHHEVLLGLENGVDIITAGHFETENIVLPVIADFLKDNLNVNVLLSDAIPALKPL